MQRPSFHRLRVACAAGLLLLGLGAGAAAQEAAGVAPLRGTLLRLRSTGAITIGYRESSLPFSFLDGSRQPAGYSIDLCREVVEQAATELGIASLAISWRPVTPETRIGAVANGEIDLECGSTTSNAERQRQVAFSPIFFVAGTKLLVRQTSGIQALRDLAGRVIVVTAGTTNEAAIRRLSERQRLNLTIATRPDHAQAFALFAEGGADAFANDDVLLYGWIAGTPRGSELYRVTGEYLSYDPYGLMFRRDDPDFAAVVNRAFTRLAAERRLSEIYTRWFMRRLPNGQRLNIPMSPHLEEVFRMLGEPE